MCIQVEGPLHERPSMSSEDVSMSDETKAAEDDYTESKSVTLHVALPPF
jgi:hypothetical protein